MCILVKLMEVNGCGNGMRDMAGPCDQHKAHLQAMDNACYDEVKCIK